MNKVVSLTLFCLLFCFCLPFLSAQENYITGKVIFQSGDTLNGYIDYRNWSRNPTKISFKESENQEASTFSCTDIQGFHVQEEHYVSATVQIETSPIGQSRLTIDSAFHYEEVTAFLQTLVEGPRSLFYQKDIYNKNQFYIFEAGEYKLLRFKRYLRHVMEKIPNEDYWVRETQTIETQDHVMQLLIYLSACADIEYELRSLDYDKQ